LAAKLRIPVEEALAMLIADRIPIPVPRDEDELDEGPGSLLQASTIEVYVAAVMELYQEQLSGGYNRNPNPRTDAITALIQQRKLDRARIARESYEDRGAYGYSGGYSAEEFTRMQAILVEDQNPLASHALVLIGS
jgi:hypothetical protein